MICEPHPAPLLSWILLLPPFETLRIDHPKVPLSFYRLNDQVSQSYFNLLHPVISCPREGKYFAVIHGVGFANLLDELTGKIEVGKCPLGNKGVRSKEQTDMINFPQFVFPISDQSEG